MSAEDVHAGPITTDDVPAVVAALLAQRTVPGPPLGFPPTAEPPRPIEFFDLPIADEDFEWAASLNPEWGPPDHAAWDAIAAAEVRAMKEAIEDEMWRMMFFGSDFFEDRP